MQKYIPVIRKIFSVVLLIAWILFIFGNSAESAEVSSIKSGAVVSFVGDIVSEKIIRKCAHVFEYTVLGLLLGLTTDSFHCINKIGLTISMVAGFLIASCDELIQLTQEGRSAQFSDVCIDFAGVVLGLIVLSGIRKVINKDL